jgi:hypothetical protein
MAIPLSFPSAQVYDSSIHRRCWIKKIVLGTVVILILMGLTPGMAAADDIYQTHEVKIQNESNEGIYPATVRVKRFGYDGQAFERQTEYMTSTGGWVTLNSGNMPKEQEWWYEIEVTAANYNTWTGTLYFTWDNNINVITLVEKKAEVLPDLVVTNIGWSPASPASGDRVTFYYTEKNQGNASASDFGSALYIDGKDIDISARGSLAAGQSRDREFTYLWTATEGSHTMTVVADWAKEVTESNENNNTHSKTLTVSSQPPTLQASLTESHAPPGNTSTQFTFTVTVQGGTPEYIVYLRDRSNQDLATSQSGSLTTYTFTHPFSTPGTYYVNGFVSDASGKTARTNEVTVVVEQETTPSNLQQYNSLPLINLQSLPFSDNKFTIVSGDQYYSGGFNISLDGPTEQIVAGKTYTYTFEASKEGGSGPDGGWLKALYGSSEILILIGNKDLEINATGKVTGAETYFYSVTKFLITLVIPAETLALKVVKPLTTLLVDKTLKPFFTFEVPAEMSDLSEYLAISIKPEGITFMDTIAVNIEFKFNKAGRYNVIFIPDILGSYYKINRPPTMNIEVPAAYTRPILYVIDVANASVPVISSNNLVNPPITSSPTTTVTTSEAGIVPTEEEGDDHIVQPTETYPPNEGDQIIASTGWFSTNGPLLLVVLALAAVVIGALVTRKPVPVPVGRGRAGRAGTTVVAGRRTTIKPGETRWFGTRPWIVILGCCMIFILLFIPLFAVTKTRVVTETTFTTVTREEPQTVETEQVVKVYTGWMRDNHGNTQRVDYSDEIVDVQYVRAPSNRWDISLIDRNGKERIYRDISEYDLTKTASITIPVTQTENVAVTETVPQELTREETVQLRVNLLQLIFGAY